MAARTRRKAVSTGVWELTDLVTGRVSYVAHMKVGDRLYTETTKKQARAERIYARWCEDKDRAEYLGEDWVHPKARERVERERVPTLSKFSEKFLELWAEGKKSERSIKNYVVQILKDKKLAKMRLDEITAQDVLRYYRRRVKTTSPATANRDRVTLYSMFERAKEWGVLPPTHANPVGLVRPEKEPEAREDYLVAEDYEAMKPHAPDWLWWLIQVGVETGLRVGNLIRLDRKKHVKRGVVSLGGAELKGNRKVNIPISRRLAKLLKEIPVAADHSLLLHHDGKPLTYKMVREAWVDMVEKAAEKRPRVAGFRPHVLRHTAATYWRMAGFDLSRVQDLLGHSDIRLTQRYAHIRPDTHKEAIELMAEFKIPSDPED